MGLNWSPGRDASKPNSIYPMTEKLDVALISRVRE